MPEDKFTSIDVPTLPPARFIAAGYYSIAYYVLGPEEGHPLVLCHGLGLSGLQFINDAHFYADQGFKVIVPDLRGHGRCRTPEISMRKDEDFSMEVLVRDMLKILDAEGVDQTHFVGCSLGGVVALAIMGTYPHRLSRFICFGTQFSLDLPEATPAFLQFASKLMRPKHLAELGARLTCVDNKDGQAIMYAMLKEMDLDVVFRTMRQLGQYDMIPNALNFEGAMLVLRCERDAIVNRSLQENLAQMAEHSYFFSIDVDRAGHCANLDRPEFIQQTIVKFIGSRTGEVPGSKKP